LAELKLSLVKSLEELEENLLSEHKKLSILQQAIALQNKELADIHEIKVNSDTLAALLFAHKEKSVAFDKDMKERQQAFEQEMLLKRNHWKKEQDDLEMARKEQEALTKKMRQREEEEYSYHRDLSRKKEKDQYESETQKLNEELTLKRISLDKEFAAREAIISAQEQEFNKLKEAAEKFPTDLLQATQETEKNITERLKFKYDYETQLAQKEMEGERKLYQQMITALEAKVANLEAQTRQLMDKSNQANLQVQDIAVKAIEGASRQRYFTGFSEKAAEAAT
jgi:hypothetical protein